MFDLEDAVRSVAVITHHNTIASRISESEGVAPAPQHEALKCHALR